MFNFNRNSNKAFFTQSNSLIEADTQFTRRKFLSVLMAGAGSGVLAACGGSGIAEDGADIAGVSKAATSAASADGTTIPSGTSIIDNAGAKWTLVNNRVTKNGNSVATGSAKPLVLMLWFGGVIYAQNADGIWYKNGSPWTSLGANDPRPKKEVAKSFFYGMNGHMAYNAGIYKTVAPATQLAMLQELGATIYRCDVASAGMSQVLADALNGPFKESGVQIMPVLNAISGHWDMNSSEAAAYTLGYNLGVNCTTPLKGLVKYIECGNELDVGLKISGDGSASTDWSPAHWPSFRGVIRGMIDGVKAVDPTIHCGVNVGIPLGYRAQQMLWDGVSPNGTSTGVGGAPSVRWDFTTYHWYKSSYNIQKAGRNATDVLQVLKDSFGKPIWLTEFGWSGSKDTPESAAAYITSSMTQYLAVKDKYDIQCIMMYCLIDLNYGLVQTDGATKNLAHAAFRKFVADNPV